MYQSIKETDFAKSIVQPKGYHILVAMPLVEEATKGGVLLPDELKYKEQVASICGCVIAMGTDAYKDEKKFPTGPWCRVGDWVIFRAYSGTKIKLDSGLEVRIINDDTVEAVVTDPREIIRA